jgi:putative hydrolase of the HAD superfamily
MVGDQLDRDVAYASAAGFETVLYPGGFEPSWALGIVPVADYVVADYRELIDVLAAGRGRSIPA